MAAVMMALMTMSFPYSKSLALLVFVVAGLTDYLDGYLARSVYGVSAFGQLMDPLADKVIVSAAFVSFVEIRLPTQHQALVPAWIVVVIISREFFVTGLRLLAANRGKVISAGKWGKHKTVWQIVAIVALLLGLAIRYDMLAGGAAKVLARYDFCFGYIAFAVALAAAMITVASGVIYFSEHKDILARHLDR
jgi:CDP-diacylglycerol--glycerol-3-phosphate 3-phosphatidyltransferase